MATTPTAGATEKGEEPQERGEERPKHGQRSLLIDDTARLLGVSRRTIYYRIRAGRLRTIRARCGSQRVLLSSIEVLLRENVPSPAEAGRRD
jgi:excisionase family DNA binding protein